MKRFYITAIISVLVLSLLSGCGSSNIYKQFNKAVAKTAGVNKASQSFDFQISVDMQNSNLNPEEKQMLEIYNTLKGSFSTKFNREKKISYTEGHVTLNNIGFDIKIFDKDNRIIIEMPLFSKYLVIDKTTLTDPDAAEPKVEATTQAKMQALLEETVTKEKIKKLDDKKLIYGSQEVSVTEFELSLGEADIKKLISTTLDVMLSDKEIKNSIIAAAKSQSQEPITDAQLDEKFNRMINDVKSSMDKVKVENFSYKGNFTKDLYLVEENISSDITVQLPESKSVKLNMTIVVKTWDIGKDITVDAPALNSENSFSPEELNQYILEMFGGIGSIE